MEKLINLIPYVLKYQLIRLRFALIISAAKRSEWLVKHSFLYSIGDNVHWQPRKLPADPKFIKLHNNISIASDVTFITHDIIHFVFNKMDNSNTYESHLGCIEIMDNCFIGAKTIILPNIRIGPNAIVAAGSIVNKDVPEGKIVGGNPAKVIGDFEYLMKQRAQESVYVTEKDRSKRVDLEWRKFYSQR